MQLRRRKWNWLGHTEKKRYYSRHCKAAEEEGDQETRGKGTAGFRYSWRKTETTAQTVVCNLCSTGSDKALHYKLFIYSGLRKSNFKDRYGDAATEQCLGMISKIGIS